MELLGTHVGQTAPLVKAKMDEARGGVLFIDEAYGLDPSRSAFGKDAIETLVANMTDPAYQGKMMIIFAGYEKDIDALLSSNVGLKRRVTERLEFKSWLPEDCWALLTDLSHKNGMDLSLSYRDMVIAGFADLASRDGWGNAGDVCTVYNKITSAFEDRIGSAMGSGEGEDVEIGNTFEECDIVTAFTGLVRQRPVKSVEKPARDTSIQLAEALAPGVFVNLAKSSTQTHSSTPPTETYLQAAEQVAEADPSEDELWASLDLALNELGYDVYATRHIAVTEELPVELVEHVSTQLHRKASKIEPMLKQQCPALLVKVTQLIQCLETELAHQRQLREQLLAADKAEKERLQEAERQRKQEKKLELVKMIGKCCAGYAWLPEGDGYRCAGGSHSVSKSQLDQYSY